MSAKKLAVFFDGTWNRADQQTKDGKLNPTNIAKLFETTAPRDAEQNPQLVHYVPGVGTETFERVIGGGFGYGISDNIKDGYKFLVSNYEPGDQIYIFGFSRGAFSARSLAGFIRNIGIIRREKLFLINYAYEKYRDKSQDWTPDGTLAVAFRRQHTWSNETIRFLGVFDTVGALGAPVGIVLGWIVNKVFKCSFHDTRLSAIVESAYHAVAIDERRLPFRQTPMIPHKRHNSTNFEEKWFPGVHSDIGGGYVSTGLSDITLKWMVDKATQHGLKFNLLNKKDSLFEPDVTAALHNSQTIIYRLASVMFVKWPGLIGLRSSRYSKKDLANIQGNGDYLRPINELGNIADFIGDHPREQDKTKYQGVLHESVIEKIRLRNGKYRPPNVLLPS